MFKADFNADWQFSLNGEEPQTVHLPHDWSIALPRVPDSRMLDKGGFFQGGNGLYSKAFLVAEELRGGRVMLEVEGAYMNAEVSVNGNLAAFHPYGYTSFVVDLTPYIVFGQENELSIAISNDALPNSRWYSGSGLYRPVWLLTGGANAVAPWGVFVKAQPLGGGARVSVDTRLLGAGRVRQSVLDAQGNSVASAETHADGACTQALELGSARLWDVDSPYLYTLKTELFEGDTCCDCVLTRFGVRGIALDKDKGFLLNGRGLNIKGGCVHHDCGMLGAASFTRAERRKVEELKKAGFNMIRCAHNPPAPAFLDACDELGMLVMDEAFDCWAMGKTPYDYHLHFSDWWKRDIESMVVRDRNHPSIVFWSTGNEIGERTGLSDGYRLAAELADAVRALDDSRPVSNALCDCVVPPGATFADATEAFLAPLDVSGYNYIYRYYEDDLQRFPGRFILGTESTPGDAYENWKLVEKHPRVIGDCVWTSLDYLGEAGIGHAYLPDERGDTHGLSYPWHLANCGDLDICCRPRLQSYYRQILWGVRAAPYIAVHRPNDRGLKPAFNYWGWDDVSNAWSFPGFEGKKVYVDVYSDADCVELFLNGKSLGTVAPARNIASFETVYEPGELCARAYKQGAPVGEDVLHTCGEPYALRLEADRDALLAEWGDLAYITATVVDKDGAIVPYADHKLYFALTGAGKLLAIGTNDPLSDEPYVGSIRSAYNGTCMAVLQSTGAPGDMTLTVSAQGIKSAQLTLRVG